MKEPEFNRADLLSVMRASRHAVVASVDPSGAPVAAVVGIAISDAFTLVFDTLDKTRKHANLERDPRVGAVFTGPGEQTVQIEGVARLLNPVLAEDAALREVYFAAFPDGRKRLAWKGLVHWAIRPLTARHTSYEGGERVTEFAWDAAGRRR
ncbi:MAG: pyridoxamine 5'-phosphate oxidase family protein [Cucumibacter sp.]